MAAHPAKTPTMKKEQSNHIELSESQHGWTFGEIKALFFIVFLPYLLFSPVLYFFSKSALAMTGGIEGVVTLLAGVTLTSILVFSCRIKGTSVVVFIISLALGLYICFPPGWLGDWITFGLPKGGEILRIGLLCGFGVEVIRELILIRR